MISKEQKAQIIAEYGRGEGDTGSGGTDRYPDSQDQRPDRPLQGKPEGSSFKKRTFEDGRTEERTPRLSQKERYREIPRTDRETWS